MAQVINTNVSALFGGAALNRSNTALQVAMERLSSGKRINSAKDDATGMVTASGYESTMRGANIAARNASDGISEAQINDGYHSQVYENLQRIREIAVQLGGTASGTETTALVAENTRLLGLATNSTAKVIGADGTLATVAGTKASVAGTLTVTGIDTDITAVTTARATYGADMAKYQSAVNNLQTLSVNTASAYSRVMDTDYAAETTAMTRNMILQQAGTAMLAQANQLPNNVLSLLR
jgi:flagellin